MRGVLAIVVWVGACAAPCSLEEFVPADTGAAAVDCGALAIDEDPASAVDCVLAAQDQGKPVRLLVQLQGIDSVVRQAFVRDAGGRSFQFFFDGFGDDPPSFKRAGRVERFSCTRFERAAETSPGWAGPGLDCVDPTAGVTVCD